ncbi:uncharacterized protein LOC134835358 [Culicoides brevitarsis]|uniref:uncharacterized protein LOC134835358 n=1 Tax=Culicoides brevitarsis TaxID=469753 RepID=UPI00307C10F0
MDDPFLAFNYSLDGIVMNVGFSLNVVPKGVTFLEFATKRIISNANSLSRAPYQVLLLISQKYNFRMHLKRTTQYGKLVDNNTRWTGLMGYLQRKEVDFASQSFVFALKRMPVIDSGFSATKYRHFFVFRHPDTHVNMKNPFLRPLDDVIWLGIFLVSVVTVFALVMIKNKEQEFMKMKEALVISVLNVIGILALQGLCSDIWSSMRAKMILMLSLIFSFILYQLYSGAIVGSLLAPSPRTITTIEKLTESGMKIVMEETASNRVIFGVSFGKDLKDLYENRVKDKEIYVSMTEGLKMMRDTRIVFLTNVDESYGLIKDLFSHAQQKELQEIPFFPQETTRAALYIPIQKKSPFSEVIRVGVLRLAEIGIKLHVVKQWELKLPKSDSNSNVLKIIDIEQTRSAFFLLLIGHLICMFLVFLERITMKIRHCLKRQRTFFID